jgi:WD40 repeat protein/serine/threonine protein kinase
MRRPAAAEFTAGYEPPSEQPGTVIGPYKLLQTIGEGGMGTVYMAEQQEPVRRMVALKIIKPGMDSSQVIARFEAERQALALMDHPNIAKVLDAGTTESGRPYFVMELVKGIPITRFCDDNQLTPRQRLELFIPVCQAVQHAHTKGIIHRDLKPSNVLVALYDDQPVPKVIDFGVAKATSQKLTERTLFTAFGSFLGTLEYMSPEQAKLNALDIDTRSDVYALGVLLYELLTGNTPLEHERLKQTALDELLRTIREEEPPRPSTRLSQSGEALATISARRGTEPAKLGQVLRGELDWIVMKALEKERTRRYETANGLAHDLQRYLADEPVEACPPTAGYKLRKFARKNKKLLVTAGAFAALLLLGVAASTWQAVRATQAETLAVAERDEKEQARQAEAEQRDDAQKQRDEARALAEKLQTALDQLRRRTYTAQMNLAQRAWDEGNIGWVLELLEQHRPKPVESDLRHFEWHYLYKLCHSDLLTLKGHTERVVSVTYSPDGKRLASYSVTRLSGPGMLKVWDSQTGKELFTLQGASGSVAFSPDGKRLAGSVGDERRVWDAQTGQELLTLQGAGSVIFSPDGKRLAGASQDQTVKVWDAQTGKELLGLQGHTSYVLNVAFSPDGRRLATVSMGADGRSGPSEVKVFDAQTGKELLALKATGRLSGFAFSPDGKRLASTTGNGTAKVWDAQTGKELLSLQGASGRVAFSPDGRRLANVSTGPREGVVKMWDAQTGQELLSVKATHRFGSVAFSPDGKRLAFDSGDALGAVKVWDAQTGQELFTLRGHTGGVNSVAFSPDGQRLASASEDRTVKVWDVQTREGPHPLKGQKGVAVFSPDSKCLAGACEDKTVKVWNAQTGQELFTLKGDDRRVNELAFSLDGKFLAIARESGATAPGEVTVCNAQTGQELFTLKGFTGSVRSVVFSPDGKHLATRSQYDSTRPAIFDMKVWDAQTGKELFTVNELGAASPLRPIFSPDSKRVTTRDGRKVKVFDARTGEDLSTLMSGTGNWYLALSPDGKRLASGKQELRTIPSTSELTVWDVQSGKELFTLKITGTFGSVVFSPDGKRLAGGSGDGLGTMKVWDAQTGQELLTVKGPTKEVHCVVFSPDGKRLASGSDDKTIKVWDAQTGQELLTLKGHNGKVTSMVFSPDGNRLSSYSPGEVKVWDATPLPTKP